MMNDHRSENQSTLRLATSQQPTSALWLYWNAGVAVMSLLSLWCPFAVSAVAGGDMTVFRVLFWLAPLGMMGLLCSWLIAIAQFFRLLWAFLGHAPDRFHRLAAFAIVVGTLVAFEIMGDYGWALHV